MTQPLHPVTRFINAFTKSAVWLMADKLRRRNAAFTVLARQAKAHEDRANRLARDLLQCQFDLAEHVDKLKLAEEERDTSKAAHRATVKLLDAQREIGVDRLATIRRLQRHVCDGSSGVQMAIYPPAKAGER